MQAKKEGFKGFGNRLGFDSNSTGPILLGPLSYVGDDRRGKERGEEQRQPNQQRWPNAPQCGANCVHHSCGQSCFSEGQGDSSVDGAGGAGSAPHLPGLSPCAVTTASSLCQIYWLIKVGQTLLKKNAPKKCQSLYRQLLKNS